MWPETSTQQNISENFFKSQDQISFQKVLRIELFTKSCFDDLCHKQSSLENLPMARGKLNLFIVFVKSDIASTS